MNYFLIRWDDIPMAQLTVTFKESLHPAKKYPGTSGRTTLQEIYLKNC